MYKRFRSIWAVLRSCKTVIFMMFLCGFGLAFGTLLAGYTDTGILSWIRSAAASRISIVGLTVSAFLPFLLSFLSVYLGYPKLLFLICLYYSFRLGYISMACYVVFGPGGWLVRLLFQFSDLFLFPVFCWFVLRNFAGNSRGVRSDITTCILSFLVITGIDYCIVSPYLAMLIDI